MQGLVKMEKIMVVKMNYDELKKHIQEVGITPVRLKSPFKKIPKNTILWFGLSGGRLTTYDTDVMELNKAFNYPFKYQYDLIWHQYDGDFELDIGEILTAEVKKQKERTEEKESVGMDTAHCHCKYCDRSVQLIRGGKFNWLAFLLLFTFTSPLLAFGAWAYLFWYYLRKKKHCHICKAKIR